MDCKNNKPVTNNYGMGVGFWGLLTIVLLVLKVLGYLNISWFVVFLPIIISFVLVFLTLFILGGFALWASSKV